MLNDIFQDSNIAYSSDIVYIYSNSAFESPLGTVYHTGIDNCGLKRPSDNYMCLGMGLPTYSRIITPNYICMCKGKGLYDHSRISAPNYIHMCKGLGLFSRFMVLNVF